MTLGNLRQNAQLMISGSGTLLTQPVAQVAFSASYALTASFASNAGAGGGGGTTSGSFTGSFTGSVLANYSASISNSLLTPTSAPITINVNSNTATGSGAWGGIVINVSADGPASGSSDYLYGIVQNNTVNLERTGSIPTQYGYYSLITRGGLVPSGSSSAMVGNVLALRVNGFATASSANGFQASIQTLTTGSQIVSGTGFTSILSPASASTVQQYIGFYVPTPQIPAINQYAFVSDGLPCNFGGAVTASAFMGNGAAVIGIVSSTFAQTSSYATLIGVYSGSDNLLTSSIILNGTGVWVLDSLTSSLAVSLPTASTGLNFTIYNNSISGTLTVIDTNRVTQSVQSPMALAPGMYRTYVAVSNTAWIAL